jgi:hypothetical protein
MNTDFVAIGAATVAAAFVDEGRGATLVTGASAAKTGAAIKVKRRKFFMSFILPRQARAFGARNSFVYIKKLDQGQRGILGFYY